MEITYKTTHKIDPRDLKELYDAAGREETDTKELARILGTSDTVFTVWYGNKLGGLLYANEDEKNAYVHDLLVNPAYDKDSNFAEQLMNQFKELYDGIKPILALTDAEHVLPFIGYGFSKKENIIVLELK